MPLLRQINYCIWFDDREIDILGAGSKPGVAFNLNYVVMVGQKDRRSNRPVFGVLWAVLVTTDLGVDVLFTDSRRKVG
ncbi:MAG: hypothetical protein ACI8XW_003006 [Gammaproteobacteria bacterium]|jgi:hypothetical protein